MLERYAQTVLTFRITYVVLLHKVQLHVSALDNGHLQVVHEILSKQYTRFIWAVYRGEVGGEMDTRSRMCHGGWNVWVHGGDSVIICYV